MISSSFIGHIFRTLRVDYPEQTIHFETQDGRVGRASNLERLEEIKPGDVILVGSDGWEQAPAELWREVNKIATVRQTMHDGSLLVDSGVGFQRIGNPLNIPVDPGNMVEYSEAQGVLEILSKHPIQSGLLGYSTDDVDSDYLRDKSEKGPTFEDFGGYHDVVARAKELIETQLECGEQLKQIGARPIKGVLFTGQPGTGKTHLARIIARESGADFYLISGPSIVSKWLGDTEGTLRKIFDAATESETGKAIIFFDEIDSIAERRSSESHEASKRLVAQLLTLMDGFDNTGKSVIVIAATNRVDTLDPALTRPGRFDWEIEFGLPTQIDRYEILKVAGKYLKTAPDLPLEDIAMFTDGWSAAELTFIWTEAALIAAGDSRAEISPEDMVRAFERIALRPRRSVVSEVSA